MISKQTGDAVLQALKDTAKAYIYKGGASAAERYEAVEHLLYTLASSVDGNRSFKDSVDWLYRQWKTKVSVEDLRTVNDPR